MAEYDLVVRGGEVATGFGTARCDIGIRGGRIAALADRIDGGTATLDAGGLLVLPGGVDSHCHIEEPSRGGYVSTAGTPPVTVNEESFVSASTSAFAGGTTSVVCFVPQWKHEGILPRLADYEQRAAKGMVDYRVNSSGRRNTGRRMVRWRGSGDRIGHYGLCCGGHLGGQAWRSARTGGGSGRRSHGACRARRRRSARACRSR
jgi:dihydroorotase-like cyclic amidohydrolase